jgi:hypothetical protein
MLLHPRWRRASCSTAFPIHSYSSDKQEREKLQFTGFVDKTHQGGLKHRKLGARFVEHHASEVNEERCVVHVFKKYMTECDKNNPFDVLYLKPKKSETRRCCVV